MTGPGVEAAPVNVSLGSFSGIISVTRWEWGHQRKTKWEWGVGKVEGTDWCDDLAEAPDRTVPEDKYIPGLAEVICTSNKGYSTKKVLFGFIFNMLHFSKNHTHHGSTSILKLTSQIHHTLSSGENVIPEPCQPQTQTPPAASLGSSSIKSWDINTRRDLCPAPAFYGWWNQDPRPVRQTLNKIFHQLKSGWKKDQCLAGKNTP